MSEDRTAALLVRIWLEPGGSTFRARLMTAGRPDGPDRIEDLTVAVATTPRDVMNAVGTWLGRFLGGGEPVLLDSDQ